MKFILDERYILSEARNWRQELDNANKAMSVGGVEPDQDTLNKDYTDRVTKIWDDFYSETFGKDADKAKALAGPLQLEIKAYGFYNNNFIDLLKYLFSKKAEVNLDAYGAVHNAVVHGTLQYKDLANPLNHQHDNIIFNKNLYSLSAGEVDEYIKLQKQLVSHFNSLKSNKNTSIDTDEVGE